MTDDERANSAQPIVRRLGAFEERDDWSAAGWCRIERALEVVGTRSAMVLVRELFYGGTRFDDLSRRAGISEAVAARRLRQLLDDGIVERVPYREPGKRTREGYRLTDRGRALFPIVVALTRWGDTLKDDRRTGLEFVHDSCGAPLDVEVRCADGHAVDVADSAVGFKDEELALRYKAAHRP